MDLRTVGALMVGLLLWSSAFAGIRAGLEDFSPGALVLLRFLAASATVLVYALVTRMPLPERRDLPRLFGLGLLGVTIYHLGLTFGEVSVTAGAASLLIASNPVFTALLSMFILGESLRAWGWVGIGISFTGVALVAFGEGGGFSFEPRALLILAAAVSSSFYFVYQRPMLRKYGPLHFASYAIWLGTIPLLVFTPQLVGEFPQASTEAIVAVIYLGVLPATVAYGLWTYAFSRAPAPLVASFLYLNPLFAIIIAWIWRDEVPAVLSLAGGLFALVGVVLVNTWGRPEERPVLTVPLGTREAPGSSSAGAGDA